MQTILSHKRVFELSRMACLLLAASSYACAAPTQDGEDESTESSSASIVGGQATSSYPAVVALTQFGSPFCTGTVVAKRVVVTAAHCLEGGSIQGWRVAFGPSAFSPQAQITVVDAIAHPSFDPNRIRNDIAVVLLAQDAPVTPIALNDGMPSSWVGKSLTFVGYGASNGRTESGAGIKRVVSIPISQVGSTQFAYQDSSRNTCFGDSGGPAFAKDAAGNLTLAGVTSYGDQTCSVYGVDTRVDVFRSFIQSASQ